MPGFDLINKWKQKNLLLYKRWIWHLFFWIGYALFRFGPYYVTVSYYPPVFLEYMLLSEIMFVATAYFTIWLYRRLFQVEKYLIYFFVGTLCWILYLCGRTAFQLWYLGNERSFKGNTFTDIFVNNITVVIVYFLFITACKRKS